MRDWGLCVRAGAVDGAAEPGDLGSGAQPRSLGSRRLCVGLGVGPLWSGVGFLKDPARNRHLVRPCVFLNSGHSGGETNCPVVRED